MKRLALISLSLCVATHFASAEDNKTKHAPAHPVAHANRAVARPMQHFQRAPQAHFNHQVHVNRTVVNHNPHINVRRTTVNSNSHVNFGNRGNHNLSHNGNQALHSAQHNITNQTRKFDHRHAGAHYAVHRADWRQTGRHDRGWWTGHYHRFARFGGGYYYWDGGFWYPAYGYDLAYNNYQYDAPIYGYNDLDPGQVIANVQTQLADAGYYQGDLDGLFGPQTRAALIAYQRDNGLPDSGEIDAETLDALGLS